MNSQIHSQTIHEEADGRTLKTTAQVEASPINPENIFNNDEAQKRFQTVPSDQPYNGTVTNSLTQCANEINCHPDRSNINDAIELKAIDTNGRRTDNRGSLPCSQSPRTMPRCHTSQRRQVHKDIHSASASPSMPSRSVHQNFNHGHVNYSSQTNSPQTGYGGRSSNTSIQSPAGAQSLNSDSPSLVHGHDGNEESTIVPAPTTRKEALQHKVF